MARDKPEEAPCIRGVPILSCLAALRTLAGYDAVNRTIGKLPESFRDAIGHRHINSSEWYPIAWYSALHAAAQEATGLGRPLARHIGRETTRADFSGIYRVFLLVVSPAALVRKAPRVYEQYFNRGSLTAPIVSDGAALLTWRGCIGFDQNLWDDMTGSVEAAIELAGGRDVTVLLTRGGSDSDADTDMEVEWRR